jgi:hypothetical protein
MLDECKLQEVNWRLAELTSRPDDIHLVIQEPLHRISAMAYHWHLLSHPFLDRRCTPHRGLRMCSRNKQKI